jgi:alginate O-acetyltransferase complex protein AlgI
VARLLGFELMENFNAPYLSRNITEFWRRCHISLSTWLKDYLYISLGGSRKGNKRTYLNLMIMMFLGGLWHAAAWTFAAWGLLHGGYLAAHKVMLGGSKPNLFWASSLSGWVVTPAKILATFHLVAITWIFFRAKDFATALACLAGILRLQGITDLAPAVLFAALLLILLDIVQTWTGDHTWRAETPYPLSGMRWHKCCSSASWRRLCLMHRLSHRSSISSSEKRPYVGTAKILDWTHILGDVLSSGCLALGRAFHSCSFPPEPRLGGG